MDVDIIGEATCRATELPAGGKQSLVAFGNEEFRASLKSKTVYKILLACVLVVCWQQQAVDRAITD